MRINLQDFFENNSLKFNSKQQSISWVKRNLKPTTLLRIGPNYLVDKKEIEILFKKYILNQETLRSKRARAAQKLNENKRIKTKTEIKA